MISFNNIGNLGRLANQMFQYASLKGIAKHKGYEFCIPPRIVFGQNYDLVRNSDVILYDVFDLEDKNNISLTSNQVCYERMHEFDKEQFNNFPDNVDLFGYYQTEKYFKHIENEIRKDFTFNEEIYEQCCEQISTIGNEIISLHIRRGDYLIDSNHPVQSIEYYEKSLSEMPDLPVIVFSDDSEWCNRQEIFQSDKFIISVDNRTDIDLCLMSLCKYHIIANSSFSWWGAWLANSEKIIAPKKWFGGNCIDKKVEDMQFGNWSWL